MKNTKSLLLILVLVFSYLLASSQKKCQISGEIIGEGSCLYISDANEVYPLKLKDGKFHVQVDKSQSPTCVSLVSISKRGDISYLSPRIWIDTDSVQLVFDISSDPHTYRIDQKYAHQLISEKIEFADKKTQLNLIRKNIDKYPALFFLCKNKADFSLSEIMSVCTMARDLNISNRSIERIEAYASAKNKTCPKVGTSFEAFQLATRTDEMYQVEQNHDKYRLLIFVSTACYFSLSAIPDLSKLHRKYKNKVDFITIWDDNERDTWLNYKSDLKSKITWTNLWDKSKFATTYFNISTSPTFYLIDKKGLIVKRVEGMDAKKLNKTIAKSIR